MIAPGSRFSIGSLTVKVFAFPKKGEIYCTLDGASPAGNSLLHTGPVTLTTTTTLKMKA